MDAGNKNPVNNLPPLRPEQRVLLLCTRMAIDEPQQVELLSLLRQPLDWNYLLQMADEHRVMSLFYWRLQAVGLDRVPEPARTILYDQFQETAWNNPRMAFEAIEIVGLLEQHGIPALAYKGPTLAMQIYGNLALRRFVDLDIMIPKQHFARAKQLLQTRGYRPNPEYVTVRDDEYLRQNHDYPFLSQDREVAVELQWGVMQVPFVFPSNFEAWWSRLRPTVVAGRMVLGLAPEDLLLILCMHGAKHMWFRLVWVCDVAALLHTFPQLDWSYIVKLAREYGCQRMLRLGLALAQEMLGAALPKELVRAIQADSVAGALARQVYMQLLSNAENSAEPVDARPFFYLRMMDRLYDKIYVCLYCSRSLLHPRRFWRVYGFEPLKHLLGVGNGD